MTGPATFGVIGSGWRAEFFVRLARLLPERLTLTGAVVRRPESVSVVEQQWGVPGYLSPAELVGRQRPDFVISSVPWAITPRMVTDVVAAGTKVLTETPPAPDLDALHRFWSSV